MLLFVLSHVVVKLRIRREARISSVSTFFRLVTQAESGPLAFIGHYAPTAACSSPVSPHGSRFVVDVVKVHKASDGQRFGQQETEYFTEVTLARTGSNVAIHRIAH